MFSVIDISLFRDGASPPSSILLFRSITLGTRVSSFSTGFLQFLNLSFLSYSEYSRFSRSSGEPSNVLSNLRFASSPPSPPSSASSFLFHPILSQLDPISFSPVSNNLLLLRLFLIVAPLQLLSILRSRRLSALRYDPAEPRRWRHGKKAALKELHIFYALTATWVVQNGRQ